MNGFSHLFRSLTAASLALCLAGTVCPGAEKESAGGNTRPELLVDTAWLDENVIDPDVVVVDVRDKNAYDQSHVPGSYWLDEGRLYVRDDGPPRVLPAEEFRSLVESAGIASDSHVIAVGDAGAIRASKLWWALTYYGLDRVSILDGGYPKWEAEGRARTLDRPYPRPAVFKPEPRPEMAVTVDQVREALGKENVVILDGRPAMQYRGKMGLGKLKGRIKGARSVPWQDTLTQGEKGLVFKSREDLLQLYRKAGVTKDSRVIAYCLKGLYSPHLLFALRLTGLNDGGANYVGSWEEWAERTDLPVDLPPSRSGSKAKSSPGP